MPELSDGEFVVAPSDEDLYRQVHPTFVDEGQLSSQVFTLNSGDNGKLSVSRSSKVSAEDATTQYIESGKRSAGAVSVTVREVGDSGYAVVDDSVLPGVPIGHAYVDAREVRISRSIARKLKNLAQGRWAYVVGGETVTEGPDGKPA